MAWISPFRDALIAACALAVWLASVEPVCAQFAPGNILQRGVSASTLIVIARLDNFAADPAAPGTLPTRPEQGMTQRDLAALSARRDIRRAPGKNTFTVLTRLKGECAGEIEFHSDALSLRSFGAEDFFLPDRCVCLLLLKSTNGQWSPAENVLPLAPLGFGFQLPKDFNVDDPDTFKNVVRILIATLDDRQTRTTSLFLLSATRDPDIVKAARRWLDDPDSSPFTQRNALACLAENQVVEMIPRIVSFAPAGVQMMGTGFPALQRYQTPEAVPYLNELLSNSNQMIVANARSALAKIGDQRTIPYLIKSLRSSRDAYPNYIELLRLVPALGEVHGLNHFREDPEASIQAAEQWWADEQAGKHATPGRSTTAPWRE